MSLKKILRFIAILFLGVLTLIVLFFVVSIVPIDRTVDRNALFTEMTNEIDTLPKVVPASSGFLVGHAKENLTPPYPTATAGYGKRRGKLYESVHDSIYVRTMVIDNGSQRVAIVSADLLIIPPTVTALLEKDQRGGRGAVRADERARNDRGDEGPRALLPRKWPQKGSSEIGPRVRDLSTELRLRQGRRHHPDLPEARQARAGDPDHRLRQAADPAHLGRRRRRATSPAHSTSRRRRTGRSSSAARTS